MKISHVYFRQYVFSVSFYIWIIQLPNCMYDIVAMHTLYSFIFIPRNKARTMKVIYSPSEMKYYFISPSNLSYFMPFCIKTEFNLSYVLPFCIKTKFLLSNEIDQRRMQHDKGIFSRHTAETNISFLFLIILLQQTIFTNAERKHSRKWKLKKVFLTMIFFFFPCIFLLQFQSRWIRPF